MARRKNICYCCPLSRQEKEQPVEGHHVVPVEYDGSEDGKKVDICASCHDLIHAEAEHYVKFGEFESDLNKKQLLLTKYIVQAKLLFLDSGKKKADGARNVISFNTTNQELAAAHMLKKKLGFTSLKKLMIHLLNEAFVANK